MVTFLLASLALAGPPATDRVAGAPLSLGQERVIPRALGAPTWSADGRTVVVARATDDGSELVLFQRDLAGVWSPERVLVRDHHPDRPALDPEGRRLAYVAGPVAALWLLDLETGVHTQLTNTAPDRRPGEPPLGWLPVPHDGPPAFQGDTLVWQAHDGLHRLQLP